MNLIDIIIYILKQSNVIKMIKKNTIKIELEIFFFFFLSITVVFIKIHTVLETCGITKLIVVNLSILPVPINKQINKQKQICPNNRF